jgi:hypothetical protein
MRRGSPTTSRVMRQDEVAALALEGVRLDDEHGAVAIGDRPERQGAETFRVWEVFSTRLRDY